MEEHTLLETVQRGHLVVTRRVGMVESGPAMEQMYRMIKTYKHMFAMLKIDEAERAFEEALHKVQGMERVAGEDHGMQAAAELFAEPLRVMKGLKTRVDQVVSHMESVAKRA